MSLFDFLSEIDTGNLAADSKWNIIQAGIEIGISENMSMTAIARELRLGGLAFANDPFRELFRELSGYRNAFDYPTKLALDYHPNPDLMVNSLFPLEGDYGYVGQVTLYNHDTGLLETRTHRFDSDDILSGAEAQRALEEHMQKYPDEFEDMIGNIEYIGAMKNSQ